MSRKLMKGTRNVLTLIALTLCSAVAQAETEYYTWVDENGITNYAERLPRGYEDAVVPAAPDATPDEGGSNLDARRPGRRPPPPVDATTADTPEQPLAGAEETGEEVDPDELIREERERLEAQLAEERRFNCDVGKRNLTNLETYRRVRIKGKDGEVRLMTPAEMETKSAEARALIKENCRG